MKEQTKKRGITSHQPLPLFSLSTHRPIPLPALGASCTMHHPTLSIGPAQAFFLSFRGPPPKFLFTALSLSCLVCFDATRLTEKTRAKMPNHVCTQRPLFGGAISCSFPPTFQDVSNIRQVPDHQEVFVDPTRDESLIVELLDLKIEVADHESATWFLRDLALEQDASDSMVLEHSGIMELPGLQYGNVAVPAMTAVGQLAVSKGRQGRGAENIVQVYLANIRLKNVSTDVLITAYEPLLINPLSESARTVGAGAAVPAEQSGCLPVQEVFRRTISSFKIHDWNLFGGGAVA
ncbi:Ran guanine nucleotide release factor [Rhynchospora pubera]|uniref:Ran guanine nucleotide release factor n=1 Tax=Rhynchospora pubera TaxID=906938 RepID=A0AAV8FKY8_9POAL|nr:Ran guanine nucleotide release factor [Rhynchospora pubera]